MSDQQETSSNQRPNFLLIMTDQQRADHLGVYGNSQVRTPQIDALAADGVVFDRFYVNAPVCCMTTPLSPTAHTSVEAVPWTARISTPLTKNI